MIRDCRTTLSPFIGGKCVTWENKDVEYLRLHSIDLHQVFSKNDRTASSYLIHASNDIENVGQGQNLQIFHFGRTIISKKNFKHQIS